MIIKTRLFLSLFALLIILSVNEAHAQPDPPEDHGSSEDQAGGGAPIAGGLAYLIVLGSAYGARKWFTETKQEDII